MSETDLAETTIEQHADRVRGQLAGGWDHGPLADAGRESFEVLLARLRTVEAERKEAWEVVQRFLTEDEADDPDEPNPTLAALVKRCFDWGDGAWYQAGKQMEAHLAAEARVEAAEQLIADGIEAFRLTREYVGENVLPETPGWSWFDWCERARAALAVSGNQP